MEIATIKAVLDACYQAQRIRAMLPTLPDGVTPSYIHFFDLIETMEQKGMRVKVSDISDRLGIPRPGVTRTVKEMEAKGYLQKVSSAQDKRVTYLSMTERRIFQSACTIAFGYHGRGCRLHDPHDYKNV